MIQKEKGNSSAKGAKGNEVAPLGINTKCSTPPCENPRAERYRLLTEARRIFVDAGKQENLEFPQNFHRTAKCIYSRFGEKVGINKSVEFKRAFYTGVVQCGSVFTCPVCAAKIQERRRLEISKAFDYAYDKLEGKKVIMVTFTFPHKRTDNLKELILKQRLAFKSFREGNVWQKRKKAVGFAGLIRSLEITYSNRNGFHPHTHEAWIVNSSVDVEKFREWLTARWFKVCSKVGLVDSDFEKEDAFFQHAIQITDWCSNSEYFAKMDDSKHWGIDRELAKSSSKQGHGKGQHPYEFLNDSIDGCKKSKYLFLEYAKAVKGVRQIFWSRGLKDLVGVNELTDEEIAKQEDDKADVLGQLNREEWNFIVKENAQSFVLDLAETSGIQAVRFWIDNRTESEDFSRETLSEQRLNINRITNDIQKRAKELRLAQYQEFQNNLIERQEFDDKQTTLRQSVRSRTLQYYEELAQTLTPFV